MPIKRPNLYGFAGAIYGAKKKPITKFKHLPLAPVREMVKISTKAPNNESLARSIKKINKKIELKWFDVRYTTGAIDQNGEFQLLNAIRKGTGETQRVGEMVTTTSIQYRGVIASPSTIVSETIVRHIIFWDAQANGGAPTIGTLLDLSTFSTAGDQVYAPYNHQYQKRYKIISDRSYVMIPKVWSSYNIDNNTPTTPNTADVVSNQSCVNFLQDKVSIGRQVKYDGDADTVAEIVTNSLYSLFLTNSNIDQSATIMFRLYYKD